MKVARVSIIENTSEEAVYSLKNYYAENFKKVFPTAERTWVVQTGLTSSLTFTIYPNQTDADATSSGRREFLDSAKEGDQTPIRLFQTQTKPKIDLVFNVAYRACLYFYSFRIVFLCL